MNSNDNRIPGPLRARVLVLGSADDFAAEISRLGADASDAARWSARSRLRVVRLDAVPSETARALARTMRAVGGDAVVSPQAASARPAQCLLIGDDAQFDALWAALSAGAEGLAAQEIQRARLGFDAPRPGDLRCGDRTLRVGERTLVMGVINATPDSFSGDGLAGDVGAMVARGEEMAAEGADLLDIGGESSRPGAQPMDAATETARVLPVIEALRSRANIPISIDTYKAEVARAALDAGATVINDISALRMDAAMAALAAARGAPVVVMHMLGSPRTMQDNPRYDDLMGEIAAYLRDAVDIAERAGVARDQVIVDPGFGFGKTPQHNLEIVRRLRELRSLGQPVLLGPSRKSTIGKVLDLPPGERLEGTLAVVALAIANGADMVRVHDVRAVVRAARMADAVVRGRPATPA
jgi:dihydropteroate synthase